MLSNNLCIVSSAGSGKSTRIVTDSLSISKEKKILILTYTLENLAQLKNIFISKKGYIPSNVSIQSRFSFLLQHGVRPYQNHKTHQKRVKSVFFDSDGSTARSLMYVKESQPRYYFTGGGLIRENRVSEFTQKCDEESGGLVVSRLEQIYDHIFIDEAQDLEGRDYDFVGGLLGSQINITLVGDPRQKILKTHRHNKHNQFDTIFDRINEKCAVDVVHEIMNYSYRCSQAICSFSDALFPDLPKTSSKNNETTGHDGIFGVSKEYVHQYCEHYKPIVLRYNKRSKTDLREVMNIGLSKGSTYDRVLIVPTGKMEKYLITGNIDDAGDLKKFYVAITRAKYSVCFILDHKTIEKISDTIKIRSG